MSNLIKLGKDEILSILNEVKLESNVVESIEDLNGSLSPLLSIGTKSSFRLNQGLLEIIGGFNSIPRKVCVDLKDGHVYVKFIELIKSIFSYKGIIVVDFNVKLISDISNLVIEMPFLDYGIYYPIYQQDYLKYARIPEESKRFLKFKSIANYIG